MRGFFSSARAGCCPSASLRTLPAIPVLVVSSGHQTIERAHMYAVIKTGGKQYKVAAGEKIKVEQIAADVGQEIVIDQVLAVGNGADLKVGTPWVAGANVKATVVAHGKHDKVRIFKMRRRKHYQKARRPPPDLHRAADRARSTPERLKEH
jgi:large subunit ribosomal protein L21